MSTEPVVFVDGRYDGRTLREWLPAVIDAIVERMDPLRIILFGSLARGEDHRDSDIDLVVVLPEVTDEHAAAVAVRRATASLPVPLDIIAVDPEEIRRRGNEIGSVLRLALREGRVVHDRAA
ncbi:MAG: nucleotidyltransferase domain-containing protein [Egibacteraceae bacterium]